MKNSKYKFPPATILILLTILIILNSCSIGPSLPPPHEHPNQGYLLVDVRTAEEFESGHLRDAVHIPYKTIGEQIGDLTCCLNQEIILYCKVGGRAEIAKKSLLKMGYSNVTNAGGYNKLKAAGKY